jgi:cell wall-associated NlpC family hydrolase
VLHPSRSALGAGLTAALLPLCLATPALTGTAAAAPVTAGPVSTASATALRISTPTAPVAAGSQRIGVRLLADGRFVPDATVVLQRRSGSTWVPAATLRTDHAGHAVTRLPVTGTTAVRAVYAGSATAPAGSSRTATVHVRRASLKAGAKAAPAAKSFRVRALQVAARQAGKPYRYGSAGPSSFDCSGLVNYAFRAVGKRLPRTSGALRAATRPVSKAAAQPGDLIFTPGHVGIYAGGGKMVDAPSAGRRVSLRRIYTSRYTVGRVV